MKQEFEDLIEALSEVDNKALMKKLLEELLTDAERKTISLRWRLVKDLFKGKTQREIAADLKISLCKITRGSKILKSKGSAVKQVLDKRFSS